ncbi:phenylalanine--tRNA ligase subunit alpha [Candidatus Shikimatogenerans bostrichidophilus]|uniref:phenylalanine--tRNA ligase subunit alpha n=1 Tax=Candidatus Shikimatogenerans bostrichidophilus TaxID=2943807 RepID=UPI002B29E248
MNLIKIIEKYINKIKYKKNNLNNLEINNIKKKYLSKNGIINKLLINLKNIKDKYKKKTGIKINYLKSEILNIINNYNYNKNNNNNNNNKIDYDFFYIKKNKYKLGSKNPIYLIKEKIKNLLIYLNFKFIDNKEIENDWYNFTALNFTKYHPSINMQDTFFIKKNILLRTHTSSIQIRYMIKNKPPIKVFTYGKVYRNESISKSSFNMFHQIELLYININVSIIDLKNIILYLLKNLFYNKYKYRYRISYFPFTKPSFEIDLYYNKKWVEIIGCGLVNKKVLNNVNINYNKYSGFALGLGIERIAMIYYNINDIRELFKNDIRFIKQFK